jgi:hypothetical protein
MNERKENDNTNSNEENTVLIFRTLESIERKDFIEIK